MRSCVIALLTSSLLLLTACGDTSKPWALRDISALMPTLMFSLHDGDGQPREAADYAGKVVLLYFGYTHCPDICPTTLARLASAVQQLGNDAGRVRILFVSVDPTRDTPTVLKAYAQAFGPRVTALSGSQEQLVRLTKRYRVTYGLGKPDPEGHYEVSHSSAVFIFDAHGAARLLLTQKDSMRKLTTDLVRLLKG